MDQIRNAIEAQVGSTVQIGQDIFHKTGDGTLEHMPMHLEIKNMGSVSVKLILADQEVVIHPEGSKVLYSKTEVKIVDAHEYNLKA